jgi:hypothetical protein
LAIYNNWIVKIYEIKLIQSHYKLIKTVDDIHEYRKLPIDNVAFNYSYIYVTYYNKNIKIFSFD